MKHRMFVLFALAIMMVVVVACAPAATPTSAPAPVVPTTAPVATAVPAPPTATSAPTAPPFPTKDITFIIPVSPGGGFDTNARLLAPFLKKYLPSQPNVVVKNVPGGEWRLGIMEMAKSAPDGHTIAIFNVPGNLVGQITGQAEYDLNKIAWIGRITDTTYVAVLSPKSPYKTLDDLRKATQVKSGVVGLTSSSALATIFAGEEMGFKVKLINFDGSTDALLAAVRGDIDMAVYPFPSVQKFVVGSTDLTPLMVFSKTRLKDLPNVPTVGDLGYEKLLSVVSLDYMVGTVPGTPDSLLKIWRDAFDKAMKDPEFLKLMTDKDKSAPNPLSGNDTAARVKDALTVYAKYKDLVMQFAPK